MCHVSKHVQTVPYINAQQHNSGIHNLGLYNEFTVIEELQARHSKHFSVLCSGPPYILRRRLGRAQGPQSLADTSSSSSHR